MKNELISLFFANINFKCPYCGIDYYDEDEKVYKRIINNKSGITKVKCLCGNIIGVTGDIKGNMVGFKLNENLLQK